MSSVGVPGAITQKRTLAITRMQDKAQLLKDKEPWRSEFQRVRRLHCKVRTGCITCKIRRKKCDKTKPACQRCKTTGRKCDGYENESSSITTKARVSQFLQSSSSHTPVSPYRKRPISSRDSSYAEGSSIAHRHGRNPSSFECQLTSFVTKHAYTALDYHCFDYFRHHTSSQFASYFDSSIWRIFVMRAALAHPVVLEAATACGAVHRRFNLGISKEAFEYCEYSLKMHSRALRSLKELESNAGPYDREAITISWFLLGLFEAFQVHYERCAENIDRALKPLLSQQMKLLHSEERYFEFETKPKTFVALLHHLTCRAVQVFGSQSRILAYYELGNTLPEVPDTFQDLEQARDFLMTEVEWILHSPARLCQSTEERSKAQVLHVGRLLKWSASYTRTIQGMSQRTSRQKQACMLLKLYRNAAYLLVYMVLFIEVDLQLPPLPSLDEEADNDLDQSKDLLSATRLLWPYCHRREDLTLNFARLNAVVGILLDNRGLFDYDEMRVNPVSERKSPVGEDLEGTPDSALEESNRPWQNTSVYGVAERLSKIEEQAVAGAMKPILRARKLSQHVDITYLMKHQRIILRYYKADELGLGMTRVQEWWAF